MVERFPTLSSILAASPRIKVEEFHEGESIPQEALKLIPKTDALRDYINKDPDVERKWVASVNGKPVGVATLEGLAVHGLGNYPLSNTKVVQVLVTPKSRGLGVGEKLMRLVIDASDVDHLAGYTNHSPGFNHLAKKYGIRDLDDVGMYDEEDENWKRDGSYEEHEDEDLDDDL